MLIRRCSALPANFPVTNEMVFSGGQFRLEEEMQVTDLCSISKLGDGCVLVTRFTLVSHRKETYSCVTTRNWTA